MQILIEWVEGCGKPDLVGRRVRLGETQATKQISSGRARAVDESEPAKPKRRSKKAKEETEAED